MKSKSKYDVTKHSDIIKIVAHKLGLSQSLTTKVYREIFKEILASLYAGNSVTIPGFAKFELVDLAPRKGRNPRTGEEIQVDAKTVVKVRRRKGLMDVPKHLA